VFDDEIDRIAEKVKSRTKALQLVERDKSIVRFYIEQNMLNRQNLNCSRY